MVLMLFSSAVMAQFLHVVVIAERVLSGRPFSVLAA
jgi:hypothetical protein